MERLLSVRTKGGGALGKAAWLFLTLPGSEVRKAIRPEEQKATAHTSHYMLITHHSGQLSKKPMTFFLSGDVYAGDPLALAYLIFGL